MIRLWFAFACLAASWLFGLPLFHQPQWLAWALCLAAGTACCAGVPLRTPCLPAAVATALLLAPAASVAPWPLRIVPVLLGAGLVLAPPDAP